jgi:hypothetical protein
MLRKNIAIAEAAPSGSTRSNRRAFPIAVRTWDSVAYRSIELTG